MVVCFRRPPSLESLLCKCCHISFFLKYSIFLIIFSWFLSFFLSFFSHLIFFLIYLFLIFLPSCALFHISFEFQNPSIHFFSFLSFFRFSSSFLFFLIFFFHLSSSAPTLSISSLFVIHCFSFNRLVSLCRTA